MAGAMPTHRSIHYGLCRRCAEKYEDTGNYMLWGMIVFVAIVSSLAVIGWVAQRVLR
jgi:hypothetical protein